MYTKPATLALSATLFFGFSSQCFAETHAAVSDKGIKASELLAKLIEGNKRFIKFILKHPNHTLDRRVETVQGACAWRDG